MKRKIYYGMTIVAIAALIITLNNALPFGKNNTVNITNKSVAAIVSTTPASDKSSAINTIVTSNTDNNSDKNSDKNSLQDDTQEALLANMMKLAQEGKIINSEFAVNTTVIDSAEQKLGKPDKTDWVPEAKGNYATFSKYDVVFGFNKGSQIFEARSFDSKIKKLSLSMVKRAYGTPAYDVKVNGEEIIGYTAGQEYKILLVFSQPVSGNSEPLMDHYSVLYPKGTVNMMADDPGRQW